MAITKGLKSIGYEVEPMELHDRMSEVDPERTGALDYMQFMKMMEKLLQEWNLEERLLESFKVFDSTDSGTISAAELRHVMTSLEIKLTDDEADDMVSTLKSQASAGQGDLIDYVAVAKHMVSTIVAESGKKGKKGKGGSKKKGKKKKK